MQFGFKELNEDEKDSLFDVLSAAAAEIPDLCENVKDFGSHSSALIATLFAGYKFLRSRYEYKKFFKHFENESRKLIPYGINSKEVDKIFKIVENYIKNTKKEEKKLSFYFLHKEKAPELVDCLFKECDNVLKDKNISDKALRLVLTNLVSLLLQNNKGVMLWTELSDITKDILDRLKQDGKNIDILKNDVEALKKALDELEPKYMTYIINAELPSVITSNIFSFRNPNITFCGRDNELTMLKEWLKSPGVSVWGITGQGGVGKSRLALHLAQLDDANWKSVWLDEALLKSLCDCTEFTCNKPVLFICDYASQYESKLTELIDKMSWTCTNAKFLLLERSTSWYNEFRRKNDIIKELSYDKPIELNKSTFSDKDYSSIIHDISKYKYNGREIPEDIKQSIIKKSKELSHENTSVRCLFLMLITDAYLRGESISIMNSEALLLNYIIHSKRIISAQYNEVIADCGLRILAYATAFNGIKWEDEQLPIQRDLDLIMKYFPDNIEKINIFFSQISESEITDIVLPLKPDLIGEFLFLHIWNNLFKPNKNSWLSAMLEHNYCPSFLARCLTDWQEESKQLYEILIDPAKSLDCRILNANVLYEAVCNASSEEKQISFVQCIDSLNYDYSVNILVKYISAIQVVFDNSDKNGHTKCIALLNNIEWNRYQCHTDEEFIWFASAYNYAAYVYQCNRDYPKALEYYDRAIKMYDSVLWNRNAYTATIYNNIGMIYQDMCKYYTSIEFYKKALRCYKRFLGNEHPETAIIYNNISALYRETGTLAKALKYSINSKIILEKVCGASHPYTARVYDNIGSILYDCCYYNKALKYHIKAQNIYLKTFDSEHPLIASTYNSIALTYNRLNDYNKALFYNLRALKIHKKHFGLFHRNTAETYGNIGTVLQNKNNLKKALKYYKIALAIYTKVLGPDHIETAKTQDNIGLIYQKTGNYKKALSMHNKAKITEEKILNSMHPYLAHTLYNIAIVYYYTGKINKALSYAQKAEFIFEIRYGETHPDTVATYHLLLQINLKKNKGKKIKEYLKKLGLFFF